MFKPRRKMKPVMTLNHPVKVEVFKPEIRTFESLRFLDLAALGKVRRTEIEVGRLELSCCEPLVRAVVENGMIVDYRIDSCSENKGDAMPFPELNRILETVARRARPSKTGGKLPVPVSTMMRSAIDVATETLTCFSICIYGFCIICCKRESTGEWLCSPRGFVVKPPKPQKVQ